MTGNTKDKTKCLSGLFQSCDESGTNWEPTEDECRASIWPFYTVSKHYLQTMTRAIASCHSHSSQSLFFFESFSW